MTFHILKCLEFQGITAGVQKEHRGLLAGLALEPRVRLNHGLPLPGGMEAATVSCILILERMGHAYVSLLVGIIRRN